MATGSKPSSGQKRVFSSIFPSSVLLHTTPTPVATPLTGFSEPGQSFGGAFDSRNDPPAPGFAGVQRSNAWSTATRFLTLPLHSPLSCNRSTHQGDVWHPDAKPSTKVAQDISVICTGDVMESNTLDRETLGDWYTHEVTNHFGIYMQPNISRTWTVQIPQSDSVKALLATVKLLRVAQQAYFAPLRFILHYTRRVQARNGSIAKDFAKKIERKFRNDLETLFDQTLSMPQFYSALSLVLYDAACDYASNPDLNSNQTINVEYFGQRYRDVAEILDGLHDVGLGGDLSQKTLARAMDRLLTTHLESRNVAVDWFGKSSVTASLKDWVANRFESFGHWALSRLEPRGTFTDISEPEDTQKAETRYWQDIAIARLGKLRVLDLFEYVKRWDQSMGAIRDLKEYITTPVARSHVVMTSIDQINTRLLSPAVSTLDVLSVYISVIKVFLELDSKGVLLGRVAKPIRSHLKLREDTVKIIVESCLAELDEEGDPINTANEVCSSLAAEMNNSFSAHAPQDNELDWADLDWVPEPLDAEPGYRKVKSDDILSYLLTLFEREEFTKELQTIMADHLLRSEDTEYEKEIRLLELFKSRFGDDKLQNCEVMLKDVQDSKRISTIINGMEQQSFSPPASSVVLQTKILSRIYWPALREDAFHIPKEILALQEIYAERFERIKDNRKLAWLNAQGRVTVSLELEDRTVTERNVQTYQASVIDAFQESDQESSDEPVTKTVNMLEDALEMDEALVRSALIFWVGKLVLREVAPDTFAVLERLDEGAVEANAAAVAAAAGEDTEMGAVKSEEDRFGEQKAVYSQFVIMMLTNQGSNSTATILMMMKMTLPGGFPFGDEDLQNLLNALVEQGTLVRAGADVWGIKK